MKISRVTSFFYPVKGGMESHLLSESSELVKLGHKVTVLTSNCLRFGKVDANQEIIQGINVNRLNSWFRFTFFSPFFPKAYLDALKGDYDILHVHSYRQPHNLALVFGKLAGKKTILSTHWPEYPDEIRGSFVNKFLKFFDLFFGPVLFKFVDCFVVQTDAEKNWLETKFNINSDKIKIIPPGIERDYLKERNGKIRRNEFGLSEDKIILCLGRVHKSKGFDKVVKVLPDLNAKLVIIGPDDGFTSELKNLANVLNISDKIFFTGSVSEEKKLEWLAACDIFILPSNYEAFGIVLLEAMSQKKPVIASNSGGMPYVVGDCGFVFDDLEDLKSKISLLIKDKEISSKLGDKGFKRAQSFTWDLIAKKLENLYKTLL